MRNATRLSMVGSSIALVIALVTANLALAACPTTIGEGEGEGEGDKPVGSEGGPCTEGGGCDPGLACRSDLCVDLGGEGEGEGGEGEGEGGEGEGEGECQGDEAAVFDVDDCDGIPTAACGPIEENAALTTCRDAALILRNGIFNEVFPCIDAIPATECDALNGPLGDCFGLITACPNTAAENLCQQAFDTCSAEGQTNFPQAACESDLVPTNQAFRQAYADCFNQAAAEPCSSVHDFCYNFALAALVDANG
jgi:hypothetical protein